MTLKRYRFANEPGTNAAVQWTGTLPAISAILAMSRDFHLTQMEDGWLRVQHHNCYFMVRPGHWVFDDGGTCEPEFFDEHWREVEPEGAAP